MSSSSHDNRALRLRLVSLVVSAMMCLCAGLQYNFGTIAPSLKTALVLSQPQLELIGEMYNFGNYFGPIPGIIVDAFSSRIVLLLAALLGLSAYSGVAIILLLSTDHPPLPSSTAAIVSVLIGVLLGIAGLSSALMIGTALKVNVSNMPHQSRAAVVSLLLLAYGLSAAVFGTIFAHGFEAGDSNTNVMAYFFMCAIVTFTLASLASWLVKIYPKASIIDDSLDEAATDSSVSSVEEEDDLSLSLLSEGSADVSSSAAAAVSWYSKALAVCIDLCSRTKFLLPFLAFLPGAGSGIMFINNLGNIAKSNGLFATSSTASCVLLLSLGSGAGRLMVSLSDWTRLRRGWFMLSSLLLMGCIHLVCGTQTISTLAHLQMASVVVGLAYGSLWSIYAVLVSECGSDPQCFGQVWGWATVAAAASSIVFNSIAGSFYSIHASPHTHECFGRHCFQATFLVCAAACLLGCIIMVWLIPRTRPGYMVSGNDE